MDKDNFFGYVMCAAVILVVVTFMWAVTPGGRKVINKWFYEVQKVDDSTNYETLKKVEDSCRAMVSSYEADKLVYEQYKNSSDKEHISWAEQAKMRANKTASTYNNYILKNSYVWEDNIPNDIKTSLEYIQ